MNISNKINFLNIGASAFVTIFVHLVLRSVEAAFAFFKTPITWFESFIYLCIAWYKEILTSSSCWSILFFALQSSPFSRLCNKDTFVWWLYVVVFFIQVVTGMFSWSFSGGWSFYLCIWYWGLLFYRTYTHF